MDDLLSYVYIGLSIGAIYAFIALGYTMVYGIVRLINFAHGEFFMAGAFAGYFVLRDAGIERLALPPPWPIVLAYAAALAAGALAAGTVAVLAERFCYRPIRRAGRIAALLTAVGLSLFLQNFARQIPAIGPNPRPWPDARVWVGPADVPDPADATYYEVRPFRTDQGSVDLEQTVVEAGGALRPEDRARLEAAGDRPLFRKSSLSPTVGRGFVIAVLVLATAALWWLVKRTRLGKAMRATSEDLEAAQLMGIDANRVITATFFVGAFIAGIGGVAYCTTYAGQVDPLTGFMPGLKAFVAAVLGGIGSIPGAVVGGLFLGLVEKMFEAYVSSQWKDVLAFVVLIVVLLVRPSGLLGKPLREKV